MKTINKIKNKRKIAYLSTCTKSVIKSDPHWNITINIVNINVIQTTTFVLIKAFLMTDKHLMDKEAWFVTNLY